MSWKVELEENNAASFHFKCSLEAASPQKALFESKRVKGCRVATDASTKLLSDDRENRLQFLNFSASSLLLSFWLSFLPRHPPYLLRRPDPFLRSRWLLLQWRQRDSTMTDGKTSRRVCLSLHKIGQRQVEADLDFKNQRQSRDRGDGQDAKRFDRNDIREWKQRHIEKEAEACG